MCQEMQGSTRLCTLRRAAGVTQKDKEVTRRVKTPNHLLYSYRTYRPYRSTCPYSARLGPQLALACDFGFSSPRRSSSTADRTREVISRSSRSRSMSASACFVWNVREPAFSTT